MVNSETNFRRSADGGKSASVAPVDRVERPAREVDAAAAWLDDDHRLVVPAAPDEDHRRRVRREIKRFNDRCSPTFAQARTPEHRSLPLDAYVLDGQGELVAGLVGTARFWWTGRGGLETDELWVDEQFRRRGYGRQLVRRVEDDARRRGCVFAHVHTFSFQARGFYERLEYRVIGQLDDYAPGVTLYWLKRDL